MLLLLFSYRWTYNEAPFDPSGNDGRIAIQPGIGTLIFARPIARDEAYYQCEAYNTVGVAVSDNVNLRLGGTAANLIFCSSVFECYPKLSIKLYFTVSANVQCMMSVKLCSHH